MDNRSPMVTSEGEMMEEPRAARMIATVREHQVGLTHPAHVAMVDVLLQHMEGELIELDLGKVMDTLIAEPIYHAWGGRFARDSVMVVNGFEAVKDMYASLMAGGFPPSEVRIERFLVDDGGIFFDGDMTTLWDGRTLQSMGENVDDPDATYIERVRTGQMMPFVDGKMRGEDLYFGPSELTKLEG